MILVSKSQKKLIASLQQQKYRNNLGLFVAEGPKVINEFLSAGINLDSLFTTQDIFDESIEIQIISDKELQKISFLKTANTSLAIFKIPLQNPLTKGNATVVLDAIRDPGNLGTIIRLCDWFGVRQLVCSEDTVDCYNPKVIQATMGSISRVQVSYESIINFIKESDLPVYGGCMVGDSIYTHQLPDPFIIVLGNEANGISKNVDKLLTHRITIPQFGEQQKTESLNVATATAILLSEFKRG